LIVKGEIHERVQFPCNSRPEGKFMSRKLARFKSKAMFTFVGGVLVINPAFGQDAATQATPADTTQQSTSQATDQAKTLDTVVVSGIRSSLDQSMGMKRDAIGVVDGVTAEDIGKFPDTNLAESLQRITGISIERRDGEGAQVTARGFGPQFNMVTLNGRQIPGADAFGAPGQIPIGGVDGGTRAVNFAQLASEAISALEVFKTGQALALPQGADRSSAALMEFARLDGTNRLIGGKVVAFDMRNAPRIYMRCPQCREEERAQLSAKGT
jgi:hypothetical protein